MLNSYSSTMNDTLYNLNSVPYNVQVLNKIFKRNHIFLVDFKNFFKFINFFCRKLRRLYYMFKHPTSGVHYTNKSYFEEKKVRAHLFFIAEPTDNFYYSLFSSISESYYKVAFFIAWDPSRFFYFLRRKRFLSFNYFPIIIASPRLYYNADFLHTLKSLRTMPVIFFFECQSHTVPQNLNYKNVFAVFLQKKNNLRMLLTFLKFLLNAF